MEAVVNKVVDAPTHPDDVYKTIIVMSAGKRTVVANLFYSETVKIISANIFGFIGEENVWDKTIMFQMIEGLHPDKFYVPVQFLKNNVQMLWDDYELQNVEF